MVPNADISQTKACFVCGKTDPGKRVSMSNFKLKYSRCEILEKLGNIVGNNLLVVCCKGDVICQHCVSVMEVIDKLENELTSSKRIILRLLENKYDLKSKYENDEDDPEPLPVIEKTETPFAMRKRKSQETVEELTNSLEQDPRERVWLECDKCYYTTNYTTFIERHVRPTPCEHCGTLLRDGLCPGCAAGQKGVVGLDPLSLSEETGPPMSPSNFLEDENVLGAIAEDETLDTNQIHLTDAEDVDDPDHEQMTYLEFVDEGENDAKTEVFHVTGDMQNDEDIWNEET